MNIDICICTYRRSHVAETLRSLAKLTLKPDWQIRVIVADNDETPSAKSIVEETAQECGFTLLYLHASARNISIARNACLDVATAPLIAFIDDDEIASPDWLNMLMATMETSKADLVLGFMSAVYAPDAPAWMRAGNFHSIKPVWVHGEIITGYTCNALVRRAATTGLRFRLELGRSGGEDTIFFADLYRAGGKIAYAPDAIVTEAVPKERARLSWLIKRHFRSGQTHGLVLMEAANTPFMRAKNAASSCIKTLFCFFMAVITVLNLPRAGYWFLRGVMHIGVVARLLGKREIEQYG